MITNYGFLCIASLHLGTPHLAWTCWMTRVCQLLHPSMQYPMSIVLDHRRTWGPAWCVPAALIPAETAPD